MFKTQVFLHRHQLLLQLSNLSLQFSLSLLLLLLSLLLLLLKLLSALLQQLFFKRENVLLGKLDNIRSLPLNRTIAFPPILEARFAWPRNWCHFLFVSSGEHITSIKVVWPRSCTKFSRLITAELRNARQGSSSFCWGAFSLMTTMSISCSRTPSRPKKLNNYDLCISALHFSVRSLLFNFLRYPKKMNN